jgi:hypothetical protein
MTDPDVLTKRSASRSGKDIRVKRHALRLMNRKSMPHDLRKQNQNENRAPICITRGVAAPVIFPLFEEFS